MVDFSGPGNLEVSMVAGIYGLGRWLTEWPVETAGDESVKSANVLKDMVRGGRRRGWRRVLGCISNGGI